MDDARENILFHGGLPRLNARSVSGSFTILVILGLLLAPGFGCSGSCSPSPAESTSDPEKVGGTATFGIAQDFETFNPLFATQAYTHDVLSQLYLSLMEEQDDYHDGPPTFKPELAEKWEISPDGLVITFFLRKDVLWSDGKKFTADDVVFSWKMQSDPGLDWDGRDTKSSIKEVEQVDDHTVRFHFTHVYPYQLMDANDGFILPARAWRPIPVKDWPTYDWSKKVVSNGPYLLDEYLPGERVVLKANPRYFEQGKPSIQKVVFRIFSDESLLMEALLRRRIDLVLAVQAEHLDDLKRPPYKDFLNVGAVDGRSYAYIAWNTARAPLDDRRVRRALSLAMNREVVVSGLWGGYAKVASSPVHSSLWAHNTNLKPLPYAPEQAQALLAEVGWTDTNADGWLDKDGQLLTFELLTTDASPLRTQAAALLREDLRKVGVQMVVRVLPYDEVIRLAHEHQFSALLLTWRVGTQADLQMFHSNGIEKGFNYMGYRNVEVDRLIPAAEHEADFRVAKPLWDQIQQILYDDLPYTVLYESQQIYAVDKRIQGVVPHLELFAGLKDWWIAAADRQVTPLPDALEPEEGTTVDPSLGITSPTPAPASPAPGTAPPTP